MTSVTWACAWIDARGAGSTLAPRQMFVCSTSISPGSRLVLVGGGGGGGGVVT